MKCRFCRHPLHSVFLDLGSAPPSNSYLDQAALQAPETWFPLKLHTCERCFLVQVDEVEHHAALFSANYAYFSSFSRTWLDHSRRYAHEATNRLGLGATSRVVEIASNDGYLLQYFLEAGIPCLGIEPTQSTAATARARGIETVTEFFGAALGQRLARERGAADLVIANNVLAHVPDLNDFVSGLSALLAPEGVLTVEFPHLMQLVAGNQFDTVYHEHFSYLSFGTVREILAAHQLRVWDVQQLGTHGGSLRVWASPAGSRRATLESVTDLLQHEERAGMRTMAYYQGFQQKADLVKNELLGFLLEQKRQGKRLAAYGAAAKGNTLLNYAGVRPDLLPYVVDASPHKQGRFLPGSRIPIVPESHLQADKPDVVLILPWNLRDEITSQLAYIRGWGGSFAVAVPALDLW